jgi:uncharacterized protein (TIGR01777 family)
MPPLRVAVTGTSGFVGSALVTELRAAGDVVSRLVRGAPHAAGDVAWDVATGAVDAQALGAADAVVHLAGESVAAGRWTRRRRREIAASRGPATERLCRALAALPQPPRTLIAASAVGFYGSRGDELLDEDSAPGSGELASVAQQWERATRPLADAGARVVNLRIGLVLDAHGGALRRLLLPFRCGLGGRIGSGRQWLSWITRRDLVRAIRFALATTALRGPVLATSPHPVTNREFTAVIARALHRPALLPVPAFALRLALGVMADELLLASQRCAPKRLLAAGFPFEHAALEAAMAALLAR